MDSEFTSLADAINKKRAEISLPKQFRSERNALFNKLYNYYTKSYKKNTWSEYVKWLKQNKFKHSKEKILEYKKVARKIITEKSFCSFWFSFIRTQDLYFLISICKDKENRGENVNKWLFWAIKPENRE